MCENCTNLRIGDNAPRFIANSTNGNLKLADYIGKWVIFFSYPGNFNPTCNSEFIEFSKMHNEIKKRNCELIALSIDSLQSHLMWINSIYNSSGIKVPFPIIADIDMSISKKYNMISPENNFQTLRCVYFLSPTQKIMAILHYPIENGRNTGEILRLLDALQFTHANGIHTPVNWLPENRKSF